MAFDLVDRRNVLNYFISGLHVNETRFLKGNSLGKSGSEDDNPN